MYNNANNKVVELLALARCTYSHNIDIKNKKGEQSSINNNQKHQQVKTIKSNHNHKKIYQKNTKKYEEYQA